MGTATATRPIIHHPRRAVLTVALAAAFAFGAGAVAVSLPSSATISDQTDPATTPATNADAQALWDQLSTLPADDRDNVVVGLSPNARAQLQATAQEIAAAAEHH